MAGLRQRGWAQRLSALVAVRLETPFAWGQNDCISFTADAVQALHERDTMAEFRTQRGSERQALRQLRAGGGVMAGMQRAGLQLVPAALAGVGDVVMLRQQRRTLLGVCNGSDVLVTGLSGLEAAPMHLAVACWRT